MYPGYYLDLGQVTEFLCASVHSSADWDIRVAALAAAGMKGEQHVPHFQQCVMPGKCRVLSLLLLLLLIITIIIVIMSGGGGNMGVQRGAEGHVAVRTVTVGLGSKTTATHAEPSPSPGPQHPLPTSGLPQPILPFLPLPTLPRSERRPKSN